MKKNMYLTLALLTGAFTWSVGQTSAMANAAAMGVGAVQSEAAQKSDVIKVHGPWGGRGWGYGGPGWGRGPGWGYGGGWRRGPGWGGPRYYGGWGGWGPYYGWRPPYYGPACRWRCGPYRCWRVCW
ncbi:hypothetical protein [Rhodomicrobium udaipurense]|uniref:Sulfur globule protein n=1 Tax=Rhodomicrobium udaipurense TaxID=1202716 RepID=A0A8I1GGI5_9HYPH|nr:hypothetical protein [Rhodomicrobium udaipurense]MBJ7543481.1 hypothetical protein [Rhodomicrobium udaipurense]